jgi:OmpA-OmpF porin, OOP family
VNKLTLAVGIAVALLAGCANAPEPAPPPPAPRQATPAPAPAPAPVAAPRRCDATVTFQNEETFPFAKADLTSAAKRRLDRDVVGKLGACASIEAVVIEGHADRIGSQQYNQKLSDRRAESVKAYLVDKGVDGNRTETIGMGKTVPAKFCPDGKDRKELIACLAPNRRAVISIKGPGR